MDNTENSNKYSTLAFDTKALNIPLTLITNGTTQHIPPNNKGLRNDIKMGHLLRPKYRLYK